MQAPKGGIAAPVLIEGPLRFLRQKIRSSVRLKALRRGLPAVGEVPPEA